MSLEQFQNGTVDRRNLSDQDKRDYNRGTKEDQKSQKIVKAKTRAKNWQEQVEPDTVSRTPGSGGFLRGREIQQLRMRKVGQERRRAETLRTID